jgi:hypothetical protein
MGRHQGMPRHGFVGTGMGLSLRALFSRVVNLLLTEAQNSKPTTDLPAVKVESPTQPFNSTAAALPPATPPKVIAAKPHHDEGLYRARERYRSRDPEELSQENSEEKLENEYAPLPPPVIVLTEKQRQEVERLRERMRASREMDMER